MTDRINIANATERLFNTLQDFAQATATATAGTAAGAVQPRAATTSAHDSAAVEIAQFTAADGGDPSGAKDPKQMGALELVAEWAKLRERLASGEAYPGRIDDELRLKAVESEMERRGPHMRTTGKYGTGRSMVYEIEFDRPMSRKEAEDYLFPGEKPAQRQAFGGERKEDLMVLQPVGGEGGKSTKWQLQVPNRGKEHEKLRPGLEDEMLKAPNGNPEWILPGTAEVIRTGKPPLPGDSRFAEVHTFDGGAVTTWREGNTVFRYDVRSGKLEGFKHQAGEEGFNRAMDEFMLRQGHSYERAYDKAHAYLQKTNIDAILIFTIGSLG